MVSILEKGRKHRMEAGPSCKYRRLKQNNALYGAV